MSDGLDVLLEGETDSSRLALQLAREDLKLLDDLVRARRSRGMTQEQVARTMGVSQATVSVFERLGNDPHLSTIRRYAWAIGVMVRHHVDADGDHAVDDSEQLWHVRASTISSAETAAARARRSAAESTESWRDQGPGAIRKATAAKRMRADA